MKNNYCNVEIISKEWKRILFESGIPFYTVVVMRQILSDTFYDTDDPYDTYDMLPRATIMLLTEEKLEILYSSETVNILYLVPI